MTAAAAAADLEKMLGERLERVELVQPDGTRKILKREDLVMLDLGAMAVAWKDAAGDIHRAIGFPLEVVSRPSSIIRPE